jgi:uncharacterized membrane protein
MNLIMVALRLIHIVTGVFWVGAGLMLTFFIVPTASANAENGQKFVQHLMSKTRISMVLAAAGGSSVLAGILLYAIDSNGFTSAWMSSSAGIGFGIGGAFGIIAFIFGVMISRNNAALGRLGAQIQGQPTPEQLSQIASIRRNLSIVSPINAWSLILATIFMSTARYFFLF